MSTEKQTTQRIGIGFWGILVLGLIFLKLLKLIDISWWWVWAPFWMPATIFIVGFVIWFIYKITSK